MSRAFLANDGGGTTSNVTKGSSGGIYGNPYATAPAQPPMQPSYGYIGNSGTIQHSSTPVTVVGQGVGANGQPNPSMVVDSSGKVVAGPNTGSYYNPMTNSTQPTPPNVTPTNPAPEAPPANTATPPTLPISPMLIVVIVILAIAGVALYLVL